MVKNIEQKPYFTVKEIAELLGLSRVAVFKRIQSGKIKAQKVGKTYIIEKAELGKVLRTQIREEDKLKIEAAVKKTIKEYGDVLKMLGKE